MIHPAVGAITEGKLNKLLSVLFFVFFPLLWKFLKALSLSLSFRLRDLHCCAHTNTAVHIIHVCAHLCFLYPGAYTMQFTEHIANSVINSRGLASLTLLWRPPDSLLFPPQLLCITPILFVVSCMFELNPRDLIWQLNGELNASVQVLLCARFHINVST